MYQWLSIKEQELKEKIQKNLKNQTDSADDSSQNREEFEFELRKTTIPKSETSHSPSDSSNKVQMPRALILSQQHLMRPHLYDDDNNDEDDNNSVKMETNKDDEPPLTPHHPNEGESNSFNENMLDTNECSSSGFVANDEGDEKIEENDEYEMTPKDEHDITEDNLNLEDQNTNEENTNATLSPNQLGGGGGSSVGYEDDDQVQKHENNSEINEDDNENENE